MNMKRKELLQRRGSSLPFYSAIGNGVPRKTYARFLRELVIAVILLAFIFALIKYHHPASSDIRVISVRRSQWSEIRPRNKLDELEVIPRNIYYLTKEDVMFCYIPKNACSRFKPLLRKREGFKDWRDPSMVHGKKNGLQRLMWLSRDRALELLRDQHFRKAIVVRDPFSRLASAYQNKVASPWPDQREDFWNKHLHKECPGMMASREMPRDGPLMSIEDFLKCLLAKDSLEPSNEHWRPQTQLCGLNHIEYDYYLHLETLSDDAKYLLDSLNWAENVTAFQIHRNPVYSKNLAEFFSKEALDLALEYYQEDFDVLQYSRIPSGKIDFYSVFDGTNYQPGFVPPVDFQPPEINNAKQEDLSPNSIYLDGEVEVRDDPQ